MTSNLRHHDSGLLNLIEDRAVSQELVNLYIFDGYPEGEDLRLNTISIDHDITYEDALEMPDRNRYTIREYTLDIYAHSKGHLDDLCSFCKKLSGETFTTSGNNLVDVYDLELIDIQHNLYSAKRFNKYYYLAFNGTNTYGTLIENEAEFNLPALIVEFDVYIPAQTITNSITLLSKYDFMTNQGILIEIRSDNRLYVTVGLNTTSFSFSILFTSYFNQRVRLCIASDWRPSRIGCAFFINGTRISSQTAFIFASVSDAIFDITIGARNDEDVLSRFCKMNLYGLRIAYDPNLDTTKYTPPEMDGEFLGTESADIILYHLNEGKNNTVYDKDERYNLKSNMTIHGSYGWHLYLEDEIETFEYHYASFVVQTKTVIVS